jgi:uncharacterized protein
MRVFAAFFGLILLGLAAMAALTYPLWTVLGPQFGFPFHRIASRLGMLVLIAGFVVVARRLGLADRTSLGYGLPRAEFLRETAIGLVLGIATMLPIVLVMVGLDMRVLRDDVTIGAGMLASVALMGILRGLAVSLIEETFMRGAMQTGIARESGMTTAIALTSVLFGAAHFIGKYRIPVEQLGPGSGLDMIAGTFAAFGRPLTVADAFLALTAVGVLLGMVRAITGNIAACIGLHTGWVFIITFLLETSRPNEASPLRFLLSQFDGVVGWLVLGWTVAMGLALRWFYRRRSGGTPATG